MVTEIIPLHSPPPVLMIFQLHKHPLSAPPIPARLPLTKFSAVIADPGSAVGSKRGITSFWAPRSPDGCVEALIQKLAYNSITLATSPSPQFNPLRCQPRSQMHTWEAKRARSEVLPELRELDPGWVALIWLSLVSSKTNRLRHGGLGS